MLLLLLVRLWWAPLESADHGAAARLNSLVASHAMVVSIVKAVTWLGSGGVLWVLIGLAVIGTAIRRRWRLAIYLLVAGAGELTLDPVLRHWSAGCVRWSPIPSHMATATASRAGTPSVRSSATAPCSLSSFPRPAGYGAACSRR